MTSIIKPEDPNAKAPLKRSTIASIVVLVLLLMGIGAYMVGSGKPRQASKAPEEEAPSAVRRGTARDVDAEFAKGTQMPMPAPIPQDARRSDSKAAGVENKFDPEAERKKALLEMEAAARVSKLMVINGGKAPKDPSEPELVAMEQTVTETGAGVPPQAPPPQAVLPAQPPAARQVERNTEWRRDIAKEAVAPTLKPKLIKAKYVLTQGKTIPAVLLRNLNSDLPGEVVAMTSVDVYDSFAGTHLLIPKGSTLVGQYSNDIATGQERIMFAFKRLIMPNGYTFDLPGATGMDTSGATGITGDVNNHFFKMFTTSFLVAFLADRVERNVPAAASSAGVPAIPGITQGSPATGARTAAGQVLVDVSRTVLEKNRVIPPTITVDAGTRINVQVTSDFEFPQTYSGARQ